MDAFSMEVRKPEEGDPDTAARIREAASAYTVSARQGDYADADGHKKVGDYRKGMDDLEEGGEGEPEAEAEQDPERRNQKSKRRAESQAARADAAREAADEEADE